MGWTGEPSLRSVTDRRQTTDNGRQTTASLGRWTTASLGRGTTAALRRRRTDDGGRTTDLFWIFPTERFRFADHTAKHAPNFQALFQKGMMFFTRYIATCHSSIKPVLRFGLFCIRIAQFAYKVGFIPSFLPRLCNISTNRT